MQTFYNYSPQRLSAASVSTQAWNESRNGWKDTFMAPHDSELYSGPAHTICRLLLGRNHRHVNHVVAGHMSAQPQKLIWMRHPQVACYLQRLPFPDAFILMVWTFAQDGDVDCRSPAVCWLGLRGLGHQLVTRWLQLADLLLEHENLIHQSLRERLWNHTPVLHF